MSKFHFEVVAHESEFEELVCDLYNAIYDTNTFQLYKSRGSNQFGIDIFSREEGIVIQCKKKDPIRKDNDVKAELCAELKTCVNKAHGLPFNFKTFILATTTKKFGVVQDLSISLSAGYPFSIQFAAWMDIEKYLHKFGAVRSRFYPHLEANAQSRHPGLSIRNSVVATGTVNVRSHGPPKVLRFPVVGTIGANPILKASIVERFNKLGEEREKRFGKKAYGVIYKNFKADFKIKNQPWTCIWDWPQEAAPAIRQYLDAKYRNTIAGRNEASRAKADSIPTRARLIGKEKELLRKLGLEMDSPQVRLLLEELFGFTSHKQLSDLHYWLLVMYLEKVVRAHLGESEN